jgi:hypothetical protein
MAKKKFYGAQEAERKKLVKKLEQHEEHGNMFRVAKQMVSKTRDIVGAGWIKDSDWNVLVQQDKVKKCGDSTTRSC